jgi:hypothetical protein
MSDTERPDTPRPWIQRRTTQVGIVLILLVAWTLAAQQWQDKDCGAGQSYGLVISHFGTPDHYQGCDEYGDFTDDYAG